MERNQASINHGLQAANREMTTRSLARPCCPVALLQLGGRPGAAAGRMLPLAIAGLRHGRGQGRALGFQENDAAVSSQHALVLVNQGQASGRQILELSRKIADSVAQEFDVTLEPEPKIYKGTDSL